MDTAKAITFGILLIIWIFVVIKVYFSSKAEKRYHNTTKFMTRVAIFGAISTLLYIFIKFPVPFLPSFLEFHFDEIPIFIAGFAYGPLSAFCVILVKTIIKLPMTSTLGVGELSDFIYSCVSGIGTSHPAAPPSSPPPSRSKSEPWPIALSRARPAA